jgi:tetratricopeptide (TPR) repeat protein
MSEMKKSIILSLFSRAYVTIPLLWLLISISYANTLYSPFVLDDMHSFIEEPNVYVKDFSYESFSKLSSTVFGKARFIPLATFSINHYFSKGQMPLYHITNIGIHLLTTLVVFWFITSLLRTPIGNSALRGIPGAYFAFFSAALWALNPVQTNAVTYIVQRMTSISAMFYLAALTFYIKGRLADSFKYRWLFYLFSGVMALCSFLSKENSFMLPAAVILVEWMFISPYMFKNILRKMKWYHWLIIILLTVLLLPLFEHRWASILNTGDYRPFTWQQRLLTQSRVIVYYISLLLLPLPGRLNFDYDFSVSTSIFSPPMTILSIILLTLVLWMVFRRRRQYPLMAFGVFWFFLNLLIESTIIPLELVFEHRLYLPSVGFYIFFLALMDLLIVHLKDKFQAFEVEQVFILLMVVFVSLLSIGTTFRNNIWRDSYTLYSDCVKKSPNDPRTHLNLGVAMGRDKNLQNESIKEFEKVIFLGKPKKENYLSAANNIVVAYSQLGEFDEAISRGEKYLDEAPDYVRGGGYPRLMYNLAYAYRQTGQYSEAMKSLVSGFTLEQRKMNGYLVNAMVKTCSDAYEHEEARGNLEITEENGNKNIAIRLRIARLLVDLRDYQKADDFLSPVVQKYPDHKLANELNERIQNELEKKKKQEELMNIKNHIPYRESVIYRTALDVSDFIINHYSPLLFTVDWLLGKAEKVSKPDDLFIITKRINLYNKMGERKKLRQELEEASKFHTDFVPLLRLIGEYYERDGNQDKAIETYEHLLEIYPSEPAWLNYQKKIIAYNENLDQEDE